MNEAAVDPIDEFRKEVAGNIEALGKDRDLQDLSMRWFLEANRKRYSYNFSWLGRPIIQYPQDIVAMQELIWTVRPDLIIETGIAHGGSLIFSASMLALLMSDAAVSGAASCPTQSQRKVLGIDIDIRAHNRAAIAAHPMASRIQMIQGSSIAPDTVRQVREVAAGYPRILVCLDSNHAFDHVLGELEAYAPLTTKGSYCVVFDTVVEDMPKESFIDRPWGPGNSPKTAVHRYLRSHPEFEIDRALQHKLLLTVAPDGFLRRTA
jgi:cephalosporin hydroxylase